MTILISDKEIQEFIDEEKHLDFDAGDLSAMKEKRGHKELDILIPRVDGSAFKIILRQNLNDSLDFSAILAYVPSGNSQDFKLRRYNGKHVHSNKLDNQKFYDFHIHKASEKYQRAGLKEETFAEVTNRYSSLGEAFDCLIKDCNVIFPKDPQMKFF